MKVRAVDDIPSLIAAFGTYRAAGDVLGMSPQALNAARVRGNLPRHLYIAQKAALERNGIKPSLSLWGFVEAAQASA